MSPDSSFKFSQTDPDVTGLKLGQVEDPVTEIVVSVLEMNPDINVATFMAWLASQTSRSPKLYQQLAAELYDTIKENPDFATQKLTRVFVKYGHGSVADMAPVFLFLNNLPMIDAFALFNTNSTHAGQELSSRYVMENWRLPPVDTYVNLVGIPESQAERIRQLWTAIHELTKVKYAEWYQIVEHAFTQQFSLVEEPVSANTLKARVLDVVRMWIPSGSLTSMSMLTSVRTWIDTVVALRESPDETRQRLGDQIHTAMSFPQMSGDLKFQTDFSGLTKYSEAKGIVDRNLQELNQAILRDPFFVDLVNESETAKPDMQSKVEKISVADGFSAGMLMLMLHIMILYPNLNEDDVLFWLGSLQEVQLVEYGKIIASSHNDRAQMSNAADIRSDTVFKFETALAYLRDLNRHRSMQRLVTMLETRNFGKVLSQGFTLPPQFNEVTELRGHTDKWVADMQELYALIGELYGMLQQVEGVNLAAILRVLPLGHNTRMYMSGSLKHILYTGSLRIRPGGDMGYRVLAYDMLSLIANSDPVLRCWLNEFECPDLESKAEFESRA